MFGFDHHFWRALDVAAGIAFCCRRWRSAPVDAGFASRTKGYMGMVPPLLKHTDVSALRGLTLHISSASAI